MNFEIINDANDINDGNYENESLPSMPRERRVFHIEKVSMSDLIHAYDKFLTDEHEGITPDDINSTNRSSNNNNHSIQNHSDNNHYNSASNFHNNIINTHAKHVCHLPNCYKEYRSKYNLRKHIKSHEGGQLLYECFYEGCGKTYKIKENLDLHYKNYHLKEKPFNCGFCSKKFSHRNGKLYHEKKKHLNILSFRCLREKCSAAYASRSALKYHLNHQHEKIL